jgi:threonylcarbamoyladenosine tRNA methylthiotransferase MtaB
VRVSVITLGCKVNQSESSVIESSLIRGGHEIVCLREKPDLCIINTCTVTAKSDYQSRQCIRRAWRAGSKVIVTGCYAELQREKVLGMEGVVKVVDNNNKLAIINELTGFSSSFPLYLRDASRSRAFLKVQDGCDYSCSYCLIPAARGKSRSVPVEVVVDRVEDISGLFEEIVLTGIHLGTYGYDLRPKVSLTYLLERILLTGVKRVRLSSLEITEVDEDLLELLKDERLCKHLHIPLQSGDDSILRMMRRGYGSVRFRQGIEQITGEIPGIAIGTDVIAGFPGEGESEYEHTRSLLESLPFAYLHVFPFSSRPGTRAATLGGQVGSTTKKVRCDELLEMGKAKKRDYMGKQVGKILDALIEERHDDGSVTGITGNYLKVRIPSCQAPLKSIVNVRIIDNSDGTLTGIPFEKIKTP